METKISPLRWAGATVLVTAILLSTWALVHRLPRRGRTVQLWSESDLPPLPGGGQNGWVLLQSISEKVASDERPGDLRDVEQLDWPELKARALEIGRFAADPKVRIQAAAARDALASPYFTDACPLDVQSRCERVKLMRLHDTVALVVLADALSGNWDQALLTAASLLRADLEMMRTSRTAISALTARRMVRKDLRCLDVLFDGIESEDRQRAMDHRARVALIASVLARGTEPDAAAPTRAAIGEYVTVTTGIRGFSDLAGHRTGRDWMTVLFLDTERTIGLANTYFEALMRFADSPSTREPPRLQRFSRGRLGWWAYNANGKMLLDALLVDLVPALRAIVQQNDEIVAASTALRKRAGTMAR